MTLVWRGLVLILAVVACAWFALSVVQARDTNRASARVDNGGRPLSPHQARRTLSLLSSAGTLNPDRTVRLLRGQLALDDHRYLAAEEIFGSVARNEPMNLEAWTGLVYAAGAARDRATVILAARHISELYPKLR
jgi:hypothetical protein